MKYICVSKKDEKIAKLGNPLRLTLKPTSDLYHTMFFRGQEHPLLISLNHFIRRFQTPLMVEPATATSQLLPSQNTPQFLSFSYYVDQIFTVLFLFQLSSFTFLYYASQPLESFHIPFGTLFFKRHLMFPCSTVHFVNLQFNNSSNYAFVPKFFYYFVIYFDFRYRIR